MSEWKPLTGLWKNDKGNLKFTMTDELREKFTQIPTGAKIIISPNQNKEKDTQPDWKASYLSVEDERPGF